MKRRPIALTLAIAATGTAVCMSVLAGWQRGGWLAERLVWVAIGVVLVVGAHLLPALVRDSPPVVRSTGALLWGACMVTACVGHATFFLLARQHAGEARASGMTAIVTDMTAHSPQPLAPVMEERARLMHQLALARDQRCTRNCAALVVRRTTLAARLDALDAEAGDIRRNEVEQDRVTTQRDALLADPVTSRLAVLLSTTPARVDLLTGLVFAAVLEGVACLLWWIALLPRQTSPATEQSDTVPAVTAAVTPVTTTTVPSLAGAETEVMKLRRDIGSGAVRPTVASIRRHLGCSQAKAAALRRQLIEPS